MELVFIIILTVSGLCGALLLAAGIVWLIEHATAAHIELTLCLIGTITAISLWVYAMWHTYSWWSIAILIAGMAHGVYVSRVIMRSPTTTNNPNHRVGGNDVCPRIYR